MRFSYYILIPIVCFVSSTLAFNDDYYQESDYQPEYRGFRRHVNPFVRYQYGRGRQSLSNLRQNRYNSPTFSSKSVPEEPEKKRVDFWNIANGAIQGVVQAAVAKTSDLVGGKILDKWGKPALNWAKNVVGMKSNDTEWKDVIRTNGTHYYHQMENVPFVYVMVQAPGPASGSGRRPPSPASGSQRRPPSPPRRPSTPNQVQNRRPNPPPRPPTPNQIRYRQRLQSQNALPPSRPISPSQLL